MIPGTPVGQTPRGPREPGPDTFRPVDLTSGVQSVTLTPAHGDTLAVVTVTLTCGAVLTSDVRAAACDVLPTVATRATRESAAAHYAAGGTVAVSVNGEATFPVTESTVTHSLTHGVRNWPELAATVDSYGDARQRFYIVTGGEPRD